MPKASTATVRLATPSPKKGSVQFSTHEPNALFTAVYLTRVGAREHLGIADLDKVSAIEVTVKAVD